MLSYVFFRKFKSESFRIYVNVDLTFLVLPDHVFVRYHVQSALVDFFGGGMADLPIHSA